MLDKDDQDRLAAKIEKAASQLSALIDAVDRAVSFYLPLHAEKWKEFNDLKNLLQLSAVGKETSVPDLYGVVLEGLDVDAAQVREAQIRYRKLAKATHPDLGGSDRLFKIVKLAYLAKDLNLLYILTEAVYNKLSIELAVLAVNRRIFAIESIVKSKPSYKLLQLDVAAGKSGVVDKASYFASDMLDLSLIHI